MQYQRKVYGSIMRLRRNIIGFVKENEIRRRKTFEKMKRKKKAHPNPL